MTDEQIIKALECYSDTKEVLCKDCAYRSEARCRRTMAKDTLDLINRQKAEIERLRDYNENLLTANTALSNEILDIKFEVIKEFAERLKAIVTINNTDDGYLDYAVDYTCLMEDIDSLVKEMTEGE